MKKSFSEMMTLETIEERMEYLKLNGVVGQDTFGHARFANQEFYKSKEWRLARRAAMVRDMGRDLGHEDYEIDGHILVHHINPITLEDIIEQNECLYDLENLVCSSKKTHDYIHYGKKLIRPSFVERSPNDQAPWLQ